MGMLYLPGGGDRFRHSSRKLLSAIYLGNELKGGSAKLTKVIAQALSLALPPFMREAFLENTLRPSQWLRDSLPSPALIRRHEVSLDVAMILYERERCRIDGDMKCRIGWTDSSPLKGYDWIWSQYHEVAQDNVIKVFNSVVTLRRSMSQFLADFEAAANDDDDDADLQFVYGPIFAR